MWIVSKTNLCNCCVPPSSICFPLVEVSVAPIERYLTTTAVALFNLTVPTSLKPDRIAVLLVSHILERLYFSPFTSTSR